MGTLYGSFPIFQKNVVGRYPAGYATERPWIMLRVNQRTGEDCLRAAVASIFQLPYDEIPDLGSSGWEQECRLAEWLESRGLGFIRIMDPDKALARGARSARLPWGVCVGEGKSPRNEDYHAVVCDARACGAGEPPKIIHDPHPSRAGLPGGAESYICFTVQDPAALRR